MTKPSKPEYKPVIDNDRNTFSIIKGPMNGDDRHETVFYQLLNASMNIPSLFEEIDRFAEEAVREGEIAPEDTEELVRESRNFIARWFRR